MRKLSFGLVVAILTFGVGVSSVLVWLTFYRHSPNQQPNVSISKSNPSELKREGPMSEDYAVYSATLSNKSDSYLNIEKRKLIVILDHTYSHSSKDGLGESELDCMKKEASKLSNDIVEDYLAKNEKAYPLANLFAGGISCALIGTDEQKKLGWERFYEKYPNSAGITTLSRVGFNRDMTRAVVYLTHIGQAGSFVFLTKENGNWVISHTACHWVS